MGDMTANFHLILIRCSKAIVATIRRTDKVLTQWPLTIQRNVINIDLEMMKLEKVVALAKTGSDLVLRNT